ncbi:MAG: PAS domain S-box protein [Anaerolineales bacterium]|jgi:two-component system nitrate/nitrite sensor histidine kinase NarX
MREDEQLYQEIFDNAADGLIIADLKTGRVVTANAAACALHGCTRADLIGRLPKKYIHPDSQLAFSNFLKAFRSGSAFDSHVLHVRCDGSTFPAEWHATAFTYQGRPCLLGVVRDVSLRIRAEQKLHERVIARTREQTALLEISHSLASTLELHPGLILEQLCEIIEYTHAGLFELSDSTLTALAVRGPKQMEQAAAFQVRLEGPETLEVLFNGHRPIRIADVTSADPQAKFLRSLLNGNAAVLLKDVRAWMWVPLAVKGRMLGGLGMAHTRRNYFTAHHAALALSMADQVAITMVNAELYEHARALAALQERQRLAQNLHDAVNQSLFSAGLIAEVLPRLWERDQEQARQSLEDLRRLTRGALAEMRALLAELRPSVLTDSSLGDLLRQLANAFTGRTNIPVSVNIAGEHVLPAEIQVALYRICQEAFNNIAKHAGASRVEIDLRYEAEAPLDMDANVFKSGAPQQIMVRKVEMRICDDGAGFDTGEASAAGHYGLGMMRERAEAVQAQLTVASQPGHGTEVRLRWEETPKKEAV